MVIGAGAGESAGGMGKTTVELLQYMIQATV